MPSKTPSSYSKLEHYKTISSEEEIDGVYSLQYSPDGSVLAVGTGNEAMRVRTMVITLYYLLNITPDINNNNVNTSVSCRLILL